VAHRLAHPPHLAIPPFADRDEQHAFTLRTPVESGFRRTSSFVQQHDIRRQRPPAIEGNAPPEPLDGVVVRNAGHVCFVRALDAMPRMREHRGQFAVVREEQQAFGVVVEAANRVDVLAHAGEEIDHRAAPLRIRPRRDVARRLVQQDVAQVLRRLDAARVHPDVVGCGVRFDAHLADGLAIDADASLRDQFFRGASGGDAGLREDFLEALLHCRCQIADCGFIA
jgi:hypothetical protein